MATGALTASDASAETLVSASAVASFFVAWAFKPSVASTADAVAVLSASALAATAGTGASTKAVAISFSYRMVDAVRVVISAVAA